MKLKDTCYHLYGEFGFGATGNNFMEILQSVDYSKFRRFLNVADEIYARLLSSFLEYEVLVVVADRYNSEFSIKAAERKRWT